jgi:hypothetical protein
MEVCLKTAITFSKCMINTVQSHRFQDPGRRVDDGCMLVVDTEAMHSILLSPAHCMFTRSSNHPKYYPLTHHTQTGLKLYQRRIYIAMGLIITTFIAVIMTVYLSCRPFNHYWQINPDPGTVCQAAVSGPILWSSFVTNVSTDGYLLLIPIPMLWKSSLRLYKKIAATMVLSAGVLVMVCATLKSIYVIVVCPTLTITRI